MYILVSVSVLPPLVFFMYTPKTHEATATSTSAAARFGVCGRGTAPPPGTCPAYPPPAPPAGRMPRTGRRPGPPPADRPSSAPAAESAARGCPCRRQGGASPRAGRLWPLYSSPRSPSSGARNRSTPPMHRRYTHSSSSRYCRPASVMRKYCRLRPSGAMFLPDS